MSGKLGTLTLDLVAKTGSFTGPLDKASKQTKKFGDDAAKYGKLAGAAIGAGAVAAVTGLALIVNKQREVIDSQAKTAQQLDTTYTSIANLERAGELGGVGLDRITAAGRQLNLNIGEAIQGTDAQVKAFKRLGISASDLAKVPLDERIATINKALTDNVQVAERAAVAADIYGAKNAKAIQQLDPATIHEAARQAELFGLNLSDVDAAKVEMANDAFSTFGLLGDGIAKQLTVELAPILKAVGDEFLKNAEKAGGLGNVVQDTVGDIVGGLAFVVNAADGVGRAFDIVADGIIAGINKALSLVANNSANILGALSHLPGIDFSETIASVKQFAIESNSVANLAIDNIEDTLNRPLAGDNFKKFYADAQAAADDAAAATVEGRRLAASSGKAFVKTENDKDAAARKTIDSINSQIASLQLQAETIGMTGDSVTLYKLSLQGATESQLRLAEAALGTVAVYEAQTKAADEAKKAQDKINSEALSIADFLQSEEESIQSSYERRRQIILENTAITGDAQANLLRDLEVKKNEDMLEINGSYWDRYLAASEEALTSFDELAGSVVENFSGQFGDAFESMVFDAATLDEAISGMAENMARSVINALGQMAAQWLAYQVVQALVGKTTQASAAATMTANAAATSVQAGLAAFASTAAIPIVGPVAAPAAMAAAVAATSPMVAAVSSLALAGMAHDGIDSVPETGTWLLQKGERVTTAETSAKLDTMLDKVMTDIKPGRAQSGQVNHIKIDMSGISDPRQARDAGAQVARQVARAVQSTRRYT